MIRNKTYGSHPFIQHFIQFYTFFLNCCFYLLLEKKTKKKCWGNCLWCSPAFRSFSPMKLTTIGSMKKTIVRTLVHYSNINWIKSNKDNLLWKASVGNKFGTYNVITNIIDVKWIYLFLKPYLDWLRESFSKGDAG